MTAHTLQRTYHFMEFGRREKKLQCEIRLLDGSKAATPIIAMTASAMDENHQRSAAAGMYDYISKPVEGAKLARLMARWTDIPTVKAKAS